MSNVIQFLETLGSNPALSTEDYVAAVAGLDVGVAQQALLSQDLEALHGLLGSRESMRCLIFEPQ